ncbi:MAG: hypothetical protein HF982_02965 [Desulfobacteraceae bacterium]|nr:hypothetical protein [Desulfobacteraceae bacterium]MBC2718545.1 hypothetical protein [Desulfobacteraceae bacterium]
MAQTAIKGIYRKGKIWPLEEVPFDEEIEVVIVFNKEFFPNEARYYDRTWQVAEKQATEDYKSRNIKSAGSVNQLFNDIESSPHED